MNVLVTGADGYIGARLASWLIGCGHTVHGVDAGYYREGCLYVDPIGMPRVPAIRFADTRNLTPPDFAGCDAVVHLAELSNDPLGQFDPKLTFAINHTGSMHVARAARTAGVRRFVYASSCSVYGKYGDDMIAEDAPLDPRTAYAQCKVLVERELAAMNSRDFAVVVLRNATAYGPSPRMRFDLVLNDLCALAWTRRQIAMISDGTPWRPVVHVEDICEAMRCALEAPADAVAGQVFNVGREGENYRIRELAQIVAEVFPGCGVTAGPPSADDRSYRVSFRRIAAELPGFRPRWTVAAGAAELRCLFERIEFDSAMHADRAYTRLNQLKHLRSSGQLDAELFWRAP